ncbi:DIT2 [Candida pseudojiufengensis]|uniref:DIT2 n=1 Tax=Candida pseudojiufengensis TaxID=497109 RepID=UPI0022244FE5|nr:DIT2 [Candida pseudojiufengensis]KAI5962375.1 DIT2 [Candida pseudojiufengensis]
MIFSLIIAYVVFKILEVVLPPWNFPRNIPTIPFYVLFLGAITKKDQIEIYNQHLKTKLEKYGAVKIYFASRWNILVSKPEMLIEIFKHEEIYVKSGNHLKIPGSVLATYTGDNIISSTGQNWLKYRNVLQNSIQFPYLDPLDSNTEKYIEMLPHESLSSVLQKYSLQNIGNCIFGIDFEISKMHKQINYIKKQIFNPFFMNFPNIERFIPSRIKAKKEVENFRNWFGSIIKENNQIGAAFKLTQAWSDGVLTEKQFLDNSIITMVAGHENPLLLMQSVLYVLAKDPKLQQKCRDSPIFLDFVIYETLRMYPPLNQIINRCTSKTTTLQNIKIPKDTYVGYINIATGRDPNIWVNPDLFLPERWSKIDYTKAKRDAILPAFHGRKRACLGEKYALTQCKTLILAILGKYNFELKEPVKFTSSGPISPVGMKLNFRKLQE